MTDRRRYGFVLLLVLGLIAASAVVMTQFKTVLGLDLRGGVELVYQGAPTQQTPIVTPDALARAVDIMRQRVDQLGVSEPQIQTSGGTQITVDLPDVKDVARAEKQVGTTARLEFYDWEANALAPNGKPVAAQLQAQDPAALQISQGGGAQAGDPGAGSMSLYDAVKLASKQPAQASKTNARKGNEYYIFGAPGSAACAQAAKDQHKPPAAGSHCLLSGPTDNPQDLPLPAGVSASQGQRLVIPPGTVVLQAADPKAGHTTAFTDPAAQFYVLHDDVTLFGNDITDPKPSTDSASGTPDVTFSFTSKGGKAFQRVTATIAHRGEAVSGLGHTYRQHFAVALDNKLITVPQIDFKLYGDGLTGGGGADITGGFTAQSAQDLATQLRLGALPIRLKLISESQVSATLGSQALHQGLIAGLAGLLVVALFLIAYYRVLGVIATAALLVYAIYFYALIKLIPITLTLPGIAGLILTIGVAADANIVIFERVKEEIRGGRSIRQGIATGYRKGLTAIIDANVVTIMTAFILFVLATAEVKGFAFTLGIGVIVSLFTAVLATQAILMSMGGSRAVSSPSTLGAGGKRRAWRFDFMGASRYFFSVSGVILLIGALAIGGRGLNLGIDFTSGTRISAGLSADASAAQVQSVVRAAGAVGPIVQKVTGDKTLGRNGFQISSKQLQPESVAKVRSALQTHFGIKSNNGTPDFNNTSVGPTFGQTVANSAVIAIIASLLVISGYVALRFEWKFAIPVLIALMHDLLITSGVYALTGREVTSATVAALLTILGYSMYDTIIVFDRVRENVPRMPRAAFSQIVNRSMSEVLTRSVATTSCTLMPIIALLLFGGATLQDFAFALLIGVASGAYSSIFIASPVLTHWKERESLYRSRRRRIESESGLVPAYAPSAGDVEPGQPRSRRQGRITSPEPENVSAAEFEQMKRDLELDAAGPPASRHTSTLTQRLAHSAETEQAPATPAKPRRAGEPPPQGTEPGAAASGRASKRTGSAAARLSKSSQRPGAGSTPPSKPDGAPPSPPSKSGGPAPGDGAGADPRPAPDVAESEGVSRAAKPKRPAKSKSRKHGRRR
ncbi:MAG: protein translocase subunit SecD [Solirubrobacteraceae bacterium]